MFGFSLGEVLFLGVLALIVIGPKQLPEVARHVGRFLNDLKRATEGFTDDIKRHAKVDFDFESRTRRPLDEPDNLVFPPKSPGTGDNEPTANPASGSRTVDAATGVETKTENGQDGGDSGKS